MSQKLCKQCETQMKLNGFLFPVMTFYHCHHEDEPKEKCWCDYPVDERSGCVGRWDIGEGYSKTWPIKFCPACGKKL